MKQILHIFAKDARHHWLEISISLAANVALVLTCAARWRTGAMSGASSAFLGIWLTSNLPDFLVFIIPVSWWLLISPVIHEERLVGDRQFWITRPYEWKKLLAAKVLFLIVFLYVPLLLAQIAMLIKAGFSPFSSLRGLVYDALGLTCALVLPLVALATVTKNFARMTLAVLGAVICLIAIAAFSSNAPPDRVAIPYGTQIFFCIALSSCAGVVILQYARRSARVSWILLVLLVVLFGAFDMGGSPDNAQMERNYPSGKRGVGTAQFVYQEKEGFEPSTFVSRRHDWVGISIPVAVSGVAEGTVTIPDFVKVTLETPSGARWTFGWQPSSMDKLFPGERVVNAHFTMSREVYEMLLGKPLNIETTFAVTQARAEKAQRLALSQNDFAVPGVGICSPVKTFSESLDEIGLLACRAPLRQPELTLVNSVWSSSSCSDKSQREDEGVQTAAWIGALERESADFGIIPVAMAPVNFTNQFMMKSNQPAIPRHLCPNTPITFTHYALAGRSRATFSIKGFQLPHLDAGQTAVMNQD